MGITDERGGKRRMRKVEGGSCRLVSGEHLLIVDFDMLWEMGIGNAVWPRGGASNPTLPSSWHDL